MCFGGIKAFEEKIKEANENGNEEGGRGMQTS